MAAKPSRNRMIKKGGGYKILFAACLLCFPMSLQATDRLKEEQGKMATLQEELDSVRLKLEFTDIKVRDTRESVHKLEDRINRQKERIRLIQEELDKTINESAASCQAIEQLTTRLQSGEAKYHDILTRFRARLVHLHKLRQGTLLDSIFSAKDLNSFLNRFQMVRYLLIQDRGMLESLEKVKTEMNTDAEALRQKQSRLTELASTTGKRREDLVFETSSLSAMLQALVLEKKLLIARREKLQQDLAELEKAVAKLEGQRSADPQKFESELTRPDPAAKKRTGDFSAPVPIPPPPPVSSFTVKNSTGYGESTGVVFQWPLKNFKIIPPNKPDAEPTFLDMQTTEPANVVSIAPGKVLFNGPMANLGNVVIVGHRNGFTSIYAGLSNIWVGLGQMIETGEVVGETGGQKSPLHLEIRLVGKNQNPLNLLVKR